MSLKSRLRQYWDAGYPIVFIESFEEDKADKIISEIAESARLSVVEWNGASGACNFKTKEPIGTRKLTLGETLEILSKDDLNRKIIVIKDMNEQLSDAETVARLKQLALKISSGIECMIIMISPTLTIPRDLEKFITVLEQDYIDDGEIKTIITEFAEDNEIQVAPALTEQLAVALKGLTEMEINNILSLAFSTDGDITKGSLQFIFEQKKQMIMKSGILEMVQVNETKDDIGGLENLKKWLERKGKVFKNINRAKDFGVNMPKGLLIAGVPGCGKSLSAKATASLFEVPLLRLDMGRLMGKYVGESEGNMRSAIRLAEAISPCVLWIDELEKAFAGIGSQNGNEVTTRLFGTFLTWLQEKTSPAFVLATANDITKMPPELLRKGRFDEIFFVDLPNAEERKKIFEVHIKKRRKKDFASIDIPKLVSMTEGYSGADIEGVVRDAVENAFCDDKNSVTTKYISDAINATTSLSEIMKDDLKKMKEEYTKRRLKSAT
ncbi:MAG: AAA family ATPase [Eubacterium sp.]|nr:AAA family ATPase [Eubacterium sp.]